MLLNFFFQIIIIVYELKLVPLDTNFIMNTFLSKIISLVTSILERLYFLVTSIFEKLHFIRIDFFYFLEKNLAF